MTDAAAPGSEVQDQGSQGQASQDQASQDQGSQDRGSQDRGSHAPDSQDAGAQSPPEAALAALIVKTLNLDTLPGDIHPEAPLYGEGLGLDSIDILEVALAISQTTGVKLRADDENNTAIFASLRRLSQEIEARRAG